MRTLKRNQRKIYYALYVGSEPITDEYGNETGQYRITYGEPIPLMINVSAAKGESAVRQFGEVENYDRTLVTDDVVCPIDESTLLWIDQTDTTQPHDYVVVKVAPSLNVMQYAVRKVNVSAGSV